MRKKGSLYLAVSRMEPETVRDELHKELQDQVSSACVPRQQVSSNILARSQLLKPILLPFL